MEVLAMSELHDMRIGHFPLFTYNELLLLHNIINVMSESECVSDDILNIHSIEQTNNVCIDFLILPFYSVSAML